MPKNCAALLGICFAITAESIGEKYGILGVGSLQPNFFKLFCLVSVVLLLLVQNTDGL